MIRKFFNLEKEILGSIISILNKYNVKILHLSVNDFTLPLECADITLHELARTLWKHTLIGVGNILPEEASKIIQENKRDLVAFGRPFIANQILF